MITGIVTFTLLLALVAYQIADRRIVAEAIPSDANLIIYDHADDIMKDASLVVEATATSHSKQVDLNHEYHDSYTLTEVTVDKVIKDAKSEAATGKPFTVIEPIFIVDNGVAPGKTVMSMGEYTKLVPGAKYILFLNGSDQQNAYWIHASYQGKINPDGKDQRKKDLYLRHANFKKLKDSVMEKLKP
jgi:hypothetical protein